MTKEKEWTKEVLDQKIKDFDESLETFRYRLGVHLNTFMPLSDDKEEEILLQIEELLKKIDKRNVKKRVDPFNKLEDVIMKLEWELPEGSIQYIAITYDTKQFEIWVFDLAKWQKKWTNLHSWKDITTRLRMTIEMILGV